MKKTFQITIGGQNFIIEEQAYNVLFEYIESLEKYFSHFDDSEEIVNDLKSRMAEKFYEMGLAEEIISVENVEEIKTAIGGVDDFESFDSGGESNTKAEQVPKPNWYTDPERRLVGGVLAGIAHKYNWDVVWLRIFFLILLAGLFKTGNLTSSSFISFSWTGTILIALYFLLLVLFPKKNNLKENPDVRKFYRDSENKMISGVASGLAIYLNVDVKIVRLFFILTSLIVFGIVIYVIMASVAPIADTVGKQLQLQGKAVTVENINQKIKESTQALGSSTRSVINNAPGVIERIFLLIGKLFRPLAGILRVLIGLMTLIIGLSIVLAAVILLIAYFGVSASSDWISTGGVDINYFTNEISNTGAIFGFFSLFIPGLVLSLTGVILTIKRKVGNKNLWLVLAALWLMGMMGSGTYIAKVVSNFTHEDYLEEAVTYSEDIKQILTIDIKDITGEAMFNPGYSLRISDDQNLKTILRKGAKGSSTKKARENTKDIIYDLSFSNDTLLLDENFTLKPEASYRAQSLRVNIHIPENTVFRFGRNFNRRSSGPFNKFKIEGYQDYEANFRQIYRSFDQFDLSDYTFKMKGEIICLDCPEPKDYEKAKD